MAKFDFHLVDVCKKDLSRHSLARLKALAPTFHPDSRERVAALELIAEREHDLAWRASLRAWIAIGISVVALGLPFVRERFPARPPSLVAPDLAQPQAQAATPPTRTNSAAAPVPVHLPASSPSAAGTGAAIPAPPPKQP